MTANELEQTILELVNQENYQPVKPRTIAKQLELPKEEFRDLKKAVKRLIRKGQLSYGPDHLVQKAQADSQDGITGIFRRASGGFGFVRPAGNNDRSNDIFIPQRKTRDAASGDLVLVRISKSRSGGFERKISGEIIDVLERDTHQFVGSYFETGGMGFVKVDGNLFSEPILVGDPGAKNAQRGDKVVIEMVLFPSHTHDGEAVITEVLGARGAPGVDTLSVIREFNLPEDFPEEVLEAARAEAEKFDESITEDRLDLTEETIITIDPEDARDFDDAISLKRIEKGHWLLGVHIADVAHFVPPGSVLDQDARGRGTSVYLPDRVIPMLPEIISNNLASLQPNRVRYTKTVMIEFTEDGARVNTQWHSAAIKSKRRFTYEEVDGYLEDHEQWRDKLTPEVFDLLGRMYELAMMLRRRRFKRGSIELSMQEVKLELDKEGRVSGAHLVENTESHQIIEEFMLAANEAVAESLQDREVLFLRRIHENPDPRKLELLTEFVRELNIDTESLVSRFEIQRLLEHVAGQKEQNAVNYAVLRSMQKAIYSPKEEGHYALAGDCYCHFTSPIRRYPDLTIHRLINHLLAEKKPTNDLGQLLILGQHLSEREQRAAQAERELIKVKLLLHLSTRIGEKMQAVITGVQDFGLFAQGTQLPAEGFIHIRSLQDDYYHYDSTSHTLTGRRAGNSYRLGDLVQVEIVHVDVDRRELDFWITGRLKHPTQPKKIHTKKKPSSKRDPKSKSKGTKKDRKNSSRKKAAVKKKKKTAKKGKKITPKKRASKKSVKPLKKKNKGGKKKSNRKKTAKRKPRR